MIKMICKRIDNGQVDSGSCYRLLAYMLNPESKIATEKCVAILGRNFSEDGLSAEEMAAEMMGDASQSYRVKEPVDHWVLSFKKGANDRLEAAEIFKAVEQWVADMGYGGKGQHKWTASIHADTGHLHCHIALCRVNALTGRVKERGYWKQDNMKALARMAKEHGWKIGGKAEFECDPTAPDDIETITDPIFEKETKVSRPHVRMADEVKLTGTFHRTTSYPKGFVWPKPHVPPDEIDKVIALLRQGKYKNLPVTREIGEELRRRGIPVQEIPQAEWQEKANKLDYKLQLNDDIKDEALHYINDKNVEFMTANNIPMWGKRRDWAKKKFQPGDIPNRIETRFEVESDLRVLHEQLKKAYAEMEPNLSSMKWGQIHNVLAKYGVEMRRREHKDGKRFGIVFSLDGENWAAASKVFPQMTWGALNGHIGAKKDSWRDARPETKEALAEARKEISVKPMPETDKKLTFEGLSVSQRNALRDIDLATARAALEQVGFKLRVKTPKPSKTAIDVAIQEARLPYHDAVVKLAELFPDVVKLGAEQERESYERVLELARQEILAKGSKWKDYDKGSMGDRCGREIVKWWQALQLDHIDLHCATGHASRVHGDRIFETSQGMVRRGIPTFIKEGCTLPELLAARPQLMAISAASDHLAPAHIFCTPHWRGNRVGIMLDDVKESFIKAYPPSAIVHTSSQSRQAFYVLDRKYEAEFYDQFMRQINAEFGDPKVLKVGHDTRPAGFFNKKRDNTKYNPQTGEYDELVKIEWSSTAKPKSFEELVDQRHADWKSVLDKQVKETKQDTPVRQAADATPDPELKEMMGNLKLVEMRPWVEEQGMRVRNNLIRRYAKSGLDRSRVDSGTARALGRLGATGDEIYTFFTRHLAQQDLPGKVRIENEQVADRQARRLAAKFIAPEERTVMGSQQEPVSLAAASAEAIVEARAEQEQAAQEQTEKQAAK